MTPADRLHALLLIAITLIVLSPGLAVRGLGDPDEAAHAMDGVLIRDWVAAGPSEWRRPIEFAEQQYGHYPTLGIGRHYPPGFAIVEAGFFAILGVSVVTAKVCVLFFAVLAVLGLYVFVRSFAGRRAAFLAGVAFVTLPATALWGRQIMLEAPTAAVAIWTAVAFTWYGVQRTSLRLGTCLALAVLAILFKQTAVFVVGAVTVAVARLALRREAPWWHAAVGAIVSAAALGAVLFSMDDACAKTLGGYDSFSNRWGWDAFTFHIRHLPESSGVLIPALAALGLLGIRRLRPVAVLLIAWFVLNYAMVTAATLKVPRFFYLGLVPIAVFAAMGADRALAFLPRRLQTATAAVLVLFVTARTTLTSSPQWADYEPIVAEQRERFANAPVLFSGLRDGDFVMAVRRHLPERAGMVVRGSKLFYTCTAGPDLDLVSYVSSPAELVAAVRAFAFPYVVVERENHVGTPQDRWFRDYLATTADYRRIATYPLQAVVTPNKPIKVTLDVYELAAPLSSTVEFYEIPMPRTGSPIRVDLRPLRGPASNDDWPAKTELGDAVSIRPVNPVAKDVVLDE